MSETVRDPRRPVHVPAFVGTFIGREADLDALDAAFRGDARVVTLWGAAGIGKTRLAARYAELQELGPAWFCDLADAPDTDAIAAIVARTLGVSLNDARGEAALERLGRALVTAGSALIVLDNCERATAAVATALTAWTSVAIGCRFLVTSRERLKSPVEHVAELAPFPLPTSADDADRSEAVQLFVQRARLRRPSFRFDSSEERQAVVAIVRHLDGLPLAVELAAGRMGVMSASELLARLPGRTDLLRSGIHGHPDRHATLDAAVASSLQVLSDAEATCLRQCLVFPGSFSLAAAEATVDLSAYDGVPSVAEVVESLVDRALLVRFEPFAGAARMRFRLYESVRVAVSKGATNGERSGAFDRLRAYAIGIARNADENDPFLVWEVDTLRDVHARLVERKPTDAAAVQDLLRLGVAIAKILAVRGATGSSVEVLDASLAQFDSVTNPALGAQALLARSRARLQRGPNDDVQRDLERAQSLAELAGDDVTLAQIADVLGMLHAIRSDTRSAADWLTRAVSLSRASGHGWTEARALHHLGTLYMSEGRFEDARSNVAAAMDVGRRAGDLTLTAICRASLGSLDWSQGRLEDALARLNSALTLLGDAGTPYSTGMIMGELAHVYQELGRWDEARAHYEFSLDAFRRTFDGINLADRLGHFATLFHERGDFEDARLRYEEALAHLADAGLSIDLNIHRAALGALEATVDRLDPARRHFDTVDAWLRKQSPAKAARSVIDAHRAHLDLAEARALEASGNAGDAAARRDAVRETMQSLDASPSHLYHARFAKRLLERALERAIAKQAAPTTTPESVSLILGLDARWFRVGDSEVVTLQRRRAPRLLLAALARERLAAPGKALGIDDLFRAGWPGERIGQQAATSRVYVALSTLRALGLRSVLLSRDDGYLLRPDLRVSFESSAD